MVRGGLFMAGSGVGASGIDDHRPRGRLRKMRFGEDNRGRAESVLGKDTRNLRSFRQRNYEQVLAIRSPYSGACNAQAHAFYCEQYFRIRSGKINRHGCAGTGSAQSTVTMLVFLPRAARTRVIATDFLTGPHERL